MNRPNSGTSCERVDRLLGVESELGRAERRVISEHLRDCEACRFAWRDEQLVRRHLRGVPVLTPPRGLEAKLLAIPTAAAPPSAMFPGQFVLLAVVAVLLLGTVAVSIPRMQAGFFVDEPALMDGRGSVAGGRFEAGDSDPKRRSVAVGLTTRVPGQTTEVVAPPPDPDEPAVAAGSKAPDAQPMSTVPVPTTGSGGGLMVVLPEHTDGSQDGQREPSAPATPTAIPTSLPTRALPEPTLAPTPEPPCIVVSAVVFADLVGDGSLECPGCDGRWSDEDEAAALAAGIKLPQFHMVVYDADDEPLDEIVLEPDGAHVTSAPRTFCAPAPLKVRIINLPAPWDACPGTDGLVRFFDVGDDLPLSFALTTGCPRLTATPVPTATPEPTATIAVQEATATAASLEPTAAPSAAFTPDVHATPTGAVVGEPPTPGSQP